MTWIERFSEELATMALEFKAEYEAENAILALVRARGRRRS